MNIVAWLLQILLGLGFALAGLAKLTRPREKLATRMTWVSHVPAPLVPAIGAAEVAGAVALVLPGAFHVATVLVPIAAACLALLMLGAIITHFVLREPPQAVPAAVLLVLSTVLAVIRATNWPL